MLRLLTRNARRPAKVKPRFFRPVLEMLEGRDCPSMPGAPGVSVTSFSVMATSGKTVTITGTVTDGTPGAAVSVSFSGVVSASATADSNGNFSTTATATSLGTVTATATDNQGQTSAPAQAQLAVAAPTITLQVVPLDKRNVLLCGSASAQSPGGLTVTLGGKVSGTTTTRSDGSFNITLEASALGDVTAATTDVWGQASNTATYTLTSNTPSITQFKGLQDGTTWTFTGSVTDEWPEGETVTFGGFPQLQGQTCTVTSNGTFSFTITLPTGLDNIATATVTDWWGLQSQEAQTLVES